MLADTLRSLCSGIQEIYMTSCVNQAAGEAMLFRKENKIWLAVSGSLCQEFCGESYSFGKVCPTDHQNRLVLNRVFPWTAPVPLGTDTSFGFGDRLGFANAAQLHSAAGTGLRPVLAQQSLRELTLTKRSIADVIDTAAWAVFRCGYRLGYACDGDHLKTIEEVSEAIVEGCTMITLDCSLVLHTDTRSEAEREAWYESFPPELQIRYQNDYLNSGICKKLGLHFSKAQLTAFDAIYGDAILLASTVFHGPIRASGRKIDLELSLDETEEVTTPEAHFYVVSEMLLRKVEITSLAPRFVGEFHKAVEYRGNLDELTASVAAHGKIARHFGYKLSLHSASEKFQALPIIAKHAGGRYHIKTSGTSWLEAAECIAKHAPPLYRKIHKLALNHLDEAKQFYVVHCDPEKIAPLDEVTDELLPRYFLSRHPDSRQLIHITYGYILADEEIRNQILEFMETHREAYEHEIEELFHRHFRALDLC